MKIVYFGNGPRGVRCLEALTVHNFTVCAVVGHDGNSDVIDFAKKSGLQTFQPMKVNASEFIEKMRQLSADIFILAGYNQILKRDIINIPVKGTINLHGGKLPDYKGVAPINWQIIKGEKIGGCCIIFVDEGIDTGDIIEQRYYEIGENDTAGDIVAKQLEIFPLMLLRAVENINNGSVKRFKQAPNNGAYYTRRYPEDGRIQFPFMTAEETHNKIRALRGPYPPAYCFYKGEKCYLMVSKLIKEKIIGTPGRIALKRSEGVVVIAKDQGVLITEVSLKKDDNPQIANKVLAVGENLD